MKAIALGVVGVAGERRAGEAQHLRGVHLAIAIKLDDHLCRRLQCMHVSGHRCAANALVLRVFDDGDAWIHASVADHRAAATAMIQPTSAPMPAMTCMTCARTR